MVQTRFLTSSVAPLSDLGCVSTHSLSTSVLASVLSSLPSADVLALSRRQ
jgi:hypothetical protein